MVSYRDHVGTSQAIDVETTVTNVLRDARLPNICETHGISVSSTYLTTLQASVAASGHRMGKHLHCLTYAASGYQRVLEENRKLYNEVPENSEVTRGTTNDVPNASQKDDVIEASDICVTEDKGPAIFESNHSVSAPSFSTEVHIPKERSHSVHIPKLLESEKDKSWDVRQSKDEAIFTGTHVFEPEHSVVNCKVRRGTINDVPNAPQKDDLVEVWVISETEDKGIAILDANPSVSAPSCSTDVPIPEEHRQPVHTPTVIESQQDNSCDFERVLKRDLRFFEGGSGVSAGDIAYRITSEASDVADTVYALLNVSFHFDICLDFVGNYNRVILS
ncbi:hypothetical protein GIB67_036360 [Kingdonia uniflora]|uniref:Uncharacterized protein n=1 Tax=Kingdonia uniflora TaxID=39325 RepID=A0A7J7L402_9MAGN|nr:hypothetical protein GIB67_036360 [Kingdonia uniflora]